MVTSVGFEPRKIDYSRPHDKRRQEWQRGTPRACATLNQCIALAAPAGFCYWLHQYALRSWFWSDDFAWLSLHVQIFDRARSFSSGHV